MKEEKQVQEAQDGESTSTVTALLIESALEMKATEEEAPPQLPRETKKRSYKKSLNRGVAMCASLLQHRLGRAYSLCERLGLTGKKKKMTF